MKRISDRLKPHYDEADLIAFAWRDEYIDRHGSTCMTCPRPGTDVHEICSGDGYRLKCRRCPAGLLFLCRKCHDELQGRQHLCRAMAVKLVKDPDNFDPEAIRDIMQPVWREARVFEWLDISKYLEFKGV